ncbi:hypothetical protein LSPH24S_03851 [Lysinibacillus sphaericus]
MTVIEALKNRRAIRNYTTQPVEKEKIEQILQAATYAPNDRMREPWHFYVLQNDAMKRYEKMASTYFARTFSNEASFSGEFIKSCANDACCHCSDC